MLKTKQEIKYWLAKHEIINYIINDDLTVDVYEDVFLSKNTPNFLVQFGTIEGDFDCSNIELTSLKGCPKIIKGNFSCSDNPLSSLKYGPIEVEKNFSCSNTDITNLKFSPKKVGNNFSCSFCKLTSFLGCLKKINGNFSCSYNQLTSFKYLPESINGNFIATANKFNSFKFFPKNISGFIYLEQNLLIKDMLVDFDCTFNDIRCDFASKKREFLLALHVFEVIKQEKNILNIFLNQNNKKELKKRL